MVEEEIQWQALTWVGGIVGYLLLLLANPAFSAFREGWQILRRHPRIWLWLILLSETYVAFREVQRWLSGEVTGASFASVHFAWPELAAVGRKAWLPALELLAGLFNQAVASYPASALAALALLTNWQGSQTRLRRAARRRWKRWWWPLYFGLLVIALAALLKPVFALSLPAWSAHLDGVLLLRLGALLDWLSFQFEYLFGLQIQIYFMLIAFVWIRGFSFTYPRVFAMAVRRGIYAAKWAGLILLASTCLIHFPLLFSYSLIAEDTFWINSMVQYIDQTARPLFAFALVIFCSVQIHLVFHNATVRGAILAHAQFVRRSSYQLFWFLTVSGTHFFIASLAENYFLAGFAESSYPQLLGRIFFVGLKGFLAAWFLASWVSFYRVRRSAPDLVFTG